MKVKGLVPQNELCAEWLVSGRRGTSISIHDREREGGGGGRAAVRDFDSGQLNSDNGIPNISERSTDRATERMSDENVRGMAFGKGEGLDSVRLHLPATLPACLHSNRWREGGRQGASLAKCNDWGGQEFRGQMPRQTDRMMGENAREDIMAACMPNFMADA